MWELPLSRALQYHHAALRSCGEWTVPLDPEGAHEKLEAARAAIERSVEAEEDPDDFW